MSPSTSNMRRVQRWGHITDLGECFCRPSNRTSRTRATYGSTTSTRRLRRSGASRACGRRRSGARP
jgi:hypothetical protein